MLQGGLPNFRQRVELFRDRVTTAIQLTENCLLNWSAPVATILVQSSGEHVPYVRTLQGWCATLCLQRANLSPTTIFIGVDHMVVPRSFQMLHDQTETKFHSTPIYQLLRGFPEACGYVCKWPDYGRQSLTLSTLTSFEPLH